MAMRKGRVLTTTLTEEERTQLMASVQVFSTAEVELYRGMERSAFVRILCPGMGFLSSRAVRLLGDCAVQRGEGTRFPQAIRLLKGGLPGYILIQPVAVYEPSASDQRLIRWNRNNRRASVDLLLALQPTGHEVPQGQIVEMPITLEAGADGGSYLVIHATHTRVRVTKGGAAPATEEQDAKEG